jgi:hypothetical protein
MAPLLTVEADARELLKMFDVYPDRAEMSIKVVAGETAGLIRNEARARVARRTGETASHIVAEESYDKKGWVVWVEPDVLISLHTSRTGRQHTQRVTYNALGGWLEFGTKYMTSRPFLFDSARLYEGDHDRRLRESLQEEADRVTG